MSARKSKQAAKVVDKPVPSTFGDAMAKALAEASSKRQAEVFSHDLAEMLARDLRSRFPVRFGNAEAGEKRAGTDVGAKRLDVNVSDKMYGLRVGVSIKTILQKDKKSGYVKNRKRIDEEFLAEAMAYHVRQPYSVLVGIYFLPSDGCLDGNDRRASSFGQWVEKLYHRSGRGNPKHDPELFERMFIGLFEKDGPKKGEVWFFDAQKAPPKKGPPSDVDLESWDWLLNAIHSEFVKRSAGFRWADDAEPLTPEEAEQLADDDPSVEEE